MLDPLGTAENVLLESHDLYSVLCSVGGDRCTLGVESCTAVTLTVGRNSEVSDGFHLYALRGVWCLEVLYASRLNVSSGTYVYRQSGTPSAHWRTPTCSAVRVAF